MSLAIDIDEVTEVLLADGWHTVVDESFYVDAYEIIANKGSDHPRIDYGHHGHSTGFAFKEMLPKSTEIVWIQGPMESIIALRTAAKKSCQP